MQVNTLYVQNLAWSTLTDDLQEAFRNCQGYEDAFVKMRKNGRPAGFGFVRFGSEETAAAAAQVCEGLGGEGGGGCCSRKGRAVRLQKHAVHAAPWNAKGGGGIWGGGER
jgi:hypothetical protein